MEVYRHQVGGHSRLMKPQDSSKVFKPYSESEHRFYEKLVGLGATSTDSGPLHVLKQFVPKYFGLTEVQVQTTVLPVPSSSSGLRRSRVEADVRQTSSNQCTGGSPGMVPAEPTGLAFTSSGTQSAPLFSLDSATQNDITPAFSSGTPLKEHVHRTDASSVAPGVEKDALEVVGSCNAVAGDTAASPTAPTSSTTHTLKYIVLEDLVYLYKKPCVMDIKMGKRQRKIGASPEKEQRQLEKSIKTTSHALGFRLCGCQFYDKKHDTLCYRDKYWGRKLTKDKLLKSIGQWFWNGYIVYHELIVPLISSLKILYSCIAELRQYRFWSSSLLWVYDGGLSDSKARVQSLGVKMIDFANTIILKDQPTQDEEYLFGLGNIIGILETLAHTASLSTSVPTTSIKLTNLDWNQSRAVLAEFGYCDIMNHKDVSEAKDPVRRGDNTVDNGERKDHETRQKDEEEETSIPPPSASASPSVMDSKRNVVHGTTSFAAGAFSGMPTALRGLRRRVRVTRRHRAMRPGLGNDVSAERHTLDPVMMKHEHDSRQKLYGQSLYAGREDSEVISGNSVSINKTAPRAGVRHLRFPKQASITEGSLQRSSSSCRVNKDDQNDGAVWYTESISTNKQEDQRKQMFQDGRLSNDLATRCPCERCSTPGQLDCGCSKYVAAPRPPSGGKMGEEDDECRADVEDTESDEESDASVGNIEFARSSSGEQMSEMARRGTLMDVCGNWTRVERKQHTRLRRPNSVFWLETPHFHHSSSSSSISSDSLKRNEEFRLLVESARTSEHVSETISQPDSTARYGMVNGAFSACGKNMGTQDRRIDLSTMPVPNSIAQPELSGFDISLSAASSRSSSFLKQNVEVKFPQRPTKIMDSDLMATGSSLLPLLNQEEDVAIEKQPVRENTKHLIETAARGRSDVAFKDDMVLADSQREIMSLSPICNPTRGFSKQLFHRSRLSRRQRRNNIRYLQIPQSNASVTEFTIPVHRGNMMNAIGLSNRRQCVSAPCLLSLNEDHNGSKNFLCDSETAVPRGGDIERYRAGAERCAAVSSIGTAARSMAPVLRHEGGTSVAVAASCGNSEPVAVRCRRREAPCIEYDAGKARQGDKALGAFTLPSTVIGLQVCGSDFEATSYSSSSDDVLNEGDVDSDSVSSSGHQ